MSSTEEEATEGEKKFFLMILSGCFLIAKAHKIDEMLRKRIGGRVLKTRQIAT